MYNNLKYMSKLTLQNKITKISVSCFLLTLGALFFVPSLRAGGYTLRGKPIPGRDASKCPAGSSNKSSGPVVDEPPVIKEENLTQLQKDARFYRSQGLRAQQIGDFDTALSFYQKAIELDPAYAAPYNDAGVIYETNGEVGRAQDSYLKAITIDKRYLPAYTNLALLYENERELSKAAQCWKKRYELASLDDPWAKKAKMRYEDINLVLADRPIQQDAREQEVMGLLKDVAAQKTLFKKDDKAMAKSLFVKAKESYSMGDDVSAFKQALDAGQLDPANKEIEDFITKIQTRLLSR
ncbi:MAG: tetratricopeptide repeat protein [Candidatus Omnitrophica bacterium]|nr:tetratricopeptide repeat protein [Candidatus Omnitrophota bacterium]